MSEEQPIRGADATSRLGERWYERYSWLLFVLIAISGIVPALQLLVTPMSGTGLFAGFGQPVPDSLLADPAESSFLAFVLRWIGTVLIGENLLTGFIAVTAWREGRTWAWLAMWYWPLLFAAHFFMYGDVLLRDLQLVWVALTILVLASNYRRFFADSMTGET